MGPIKGITPNILFVAASVAVILGILWALVIYYERILRWSLNNKLEVYDTPLVYHSFRNGYLVGI